MAEEKMPELPEEEKSEGKSEEKKGGSMEQLMPLMNMLAAKEGASGHQGPLWVIGGVLLLGLLLNGGLGGLGGNAGVDQRLILEQGAALSSKIDNSLFQSTLQNNQMQNALQTQISSGFCATNENIGALRGEFAAGKAEILCAIHNLGQQQKIDVLEARVAELQRYVPLPVPPVQQVDITGQINATVTNAVAQALAMQRMSAA
jgi:hypothetical protein